MERRTADGRKVGSNALEAWLSVMRGKEKSAIQKWYDMNEAAFYAPSESRRIRYTSADLYILTERAADEGDGAADLRKKVKTLLAYIRKTDGAHGRALALCKAIMQAGSTSGSDLARILGCTRQTAEYRVKRLMRRKDIRRKAFELGIVASL